MCAKANPDEHIDALVSRLDPPCAKVKGVRARTLSEQISIGHFRRRIAVPACAIHEQNSSDPPAPELPKRSIDFALTVPSRRMFVMRKKWTVEALCPRASGPPASSRVEQRLQRRDPRRLRGTGGGAQCPPTAAVCHSPRLSSNRAT